MDTPICDFVKRYAEEKKLRLHMPGHKGTKVLGAEPFDITEIKGADSLYEADGIIAQSEKNASELFGAKTFYSAEGSSLAIRAMLCLVALFARENGCERPIILAGRNAHKSFVYAAAMLDADVRWISPPKDGSYLSCGVCAKDIETIFERGEIPTALYLTSPDYLGNVAPIADISAVCRRFGVLLLVDNAHGAYLKFLQPSRHPIDLGAHMCCDSAHKTLPVLTGGAYLHISDDAPSLFAKEAKNALATFGSTSPSYLILQSLDAANRILSENFSKKLGALAKKLEECRWELEKCGYRFAGEEPLKLTVCPKKRGYTGYELAEILREKGIECEFADPDFVVLMFSSATRSEDISYLKEVLLAVPARKELKERAPEAYLPERVLSVREASLAPRETLSAGECLGRVLAFSNVGCPPAVPIVVCGERIDQRAIELFSYYGIERCTVVK